MKKCNESIAEGQEPSSVLDVAEDARSVLDGLVRQGAQQMLGAALETEVDEFLDRHQSLRDERGNRRVVRNGHLPKRKILTGAGPLEVRQPRVRDRHGDEEETVRFSSSILPPYLRRSRTIDELIPWLYLKGISTGVFPRRSKRWSVPAPRGSAPT